MTELLTAAQMRAIEQAAIESGEVTGLELMERAGQGVVEAILEEWPEMALAPHRAVVLCGPGNNGGDGFVVARLLHQLGWDVEVFLYGEAGKLPSDARTSYERWLNFGSVSPLKDDLYPECNLVIDAIFGTGLSRPTDDLGLLFYTLADLDNMAGGIPYADRIGSLSKVPFVVSIDLPSGLCSDSGRHLERVDQGFEPPPDFCEAIYAGLTVTFHRPKRGHFLNLGPTLSKKLKVVDLGGAIQRAKLRKAEESTYLLSGFWNSHYKSVLDNKFVHGHALILTGRSGKTGAGRLAARATLRIGAGLVTVGCPPSAKLECAMQLTAVMLRSINDVEEFGEVLGDTRINALCLGPAMGLNARTRAFVEVALKSGRACVLDADALTIFQDDPEQLFTLLHKNCVLTPHGGEFKRLFPDLQAKLDAPATAGPAYSKVDATREAATRAGCTVLHKGADTVIADEMGNASINSSQYERAAPWLATAGSGDVLAGFVTGLLARGHGPYSAARGGAWLHTECALSFGPGLIAEDIPEELPKVFRKHGI